MTRSSVLSVVWTTSSLLRLARIDATRPSSSCTSLPGDGGFGMLFSANRPLHCQRDRTSQWGWYCVRNLDDLLRKIPAQDKSIWEALKQHSLIYTYPTATAWMNKDLAMAKCYRRA